MTFVFTLKELRKLGNGSLALLRDLLEEVEEGSSEGGLGFEGVEGLKARSDVRRVQIVEK
jgi:hypothetical protein